MEEHKILVRSDGKSCECVTASFVESIPEAKVYSLAQITKVIKDYSGNRTIHVRERIGTIGFDASLCSKCETYLLWQMIGRLQDENKWSF